MTWYSRSEWTDSKGGCVAVLQDVKGVAIHYPGGNIPDGVAAGNHEATANYLAGVRNMQMASTKYDYCDIEYSMCADRAGDVWALRGLNVRPGSNGTYGSNMQYPSIFVLVGLTENRKPTPEQIKAIRQVVRRVRDKYPGAKEIRGHREFVATACPGQALWELIENGTFEPAFARRQLKRTRAQLRRQAKRIKARIKKITDRLRKG